MSKVDNKQMIYETHIRAVYALIKRDMRYHHKFCVLYEVPPFIIGKPPYNMKECLVFLISYLRKKKLKVVYKSPNILFIRWFDKKIMRKIINDFQNRIPEEEEQVDKYAVINYKRLEEDKREQKRKAKLLKSDFDEYPLSDKIHDILKIASFL